MAKAPKIIEESSDQKKQRETVETIAKHISLLSNSVNDLLRGPVKRKALLILLSHSSGLSMTNVDAVLSALQDLDKQWLNK